MTVKTTGAEFNRFYTDVTYWTADIWHEDEVITINGAPRNPDESLDNLPDDAVVCIQDGFIDSSRSDWKVVSLESFFKKWRKAQTTKTVVVSCTPENYAEVVAAIEKAGGRVVVK